jgi:uncharacterized cupin superfamily protein
MERSIVQPPKVPPLIQPDVRLQHACLESRAAQHAHCSPLFTPMPKLDTSVWKQHPATINRFTGKSNGPRGELALGEQVHLGQFGAHLETLPPGSRSSFRHWHETEDELVFVLAGELVLVENQECVLKAGDAAAWKAGVPVGHCLENRSEQLATFLVVGGKATRGTVHYPEHGIVMHHDEGGRRFMRADGSPLPEAP